MGQEHTSSWRRRPYPALPFSPPSQHPHINPPPSAQRRRRACGGWGCCQPRSPAACGARPAQPARQGGGGRQGSTPGGPSRVGWFLRIKPAAFMPAPPGINAAGAAVASDSCLMHCAPPARPQQPEQGTLLCLACSTAAAPPPHSPWPLCAARPPSWPACRAGPPPHSTCSAVGGRQAAPWVGHSLGAEWWAHVHAAASRASPPNKQRILLPVPPQ